MPPPSPPSPVFQLGFKTNSDISARCPNSISFAIAATVPSYNFLGKRRPRLGIDSESLFMLHLDGLMAQGTIKRIDLGAALRCFMGPFAAHIINDYLLNIPDERAPDSQIMIDTAVMIFLHGLDYNEG